MPRLRSASVSLVAFVFVFAFAAAGCTSLGSHDVELTITAAPSVTDAVLGSVTTLELGASSAGHGASTMDPLGRPLARTERVTIHASSDRGPLDVGVIAHDAAGNAVAAGHSELMLDGTGPHTLAITLMPAPADGQLLTIAPTTYTLLTGDTMTFTATADVAWSVQEGAAGGNIDANGNYTAPDSGGSYTIVASSTSYYGHQATATVQVLAAGVVNFAGKLGGAGFADGPLGTGRLVRPQGMVSDGQSIFFTTQDKLVRKLDIKSGTLSTIAGALDLPAPIDGTGGAAHFSDPRQIARDSTGNLYVADSLSGAIRKVEIATGKVTTFAGKLGMPGLSTDGVGTAAVFGNPTGIAWDGARTLFVSDDNACNIRKIDLQTAAVTTLAGTASGMNAACGHADGTGTAAQFANIESIAYDGQGTLYVAELQYLRKVDVTTGKVTSVPSGSGEEIASDGNGGLWVVAVQLGQVDVNTGKVTVIQAPPPGVGNWNIGANTITFAPDGTAYVGTEDAIYALDIANRKLTLVGGVPAYSDVLTDNPTTDGPLSTTRLNYLNGLDLGPDGILYTHPNDGWLAIDPMARTSKKVAAPFDFGCCVDLRSDGKGTIYGVGYDFTFRSISIGATSSTIIAGSAGTPGFADGTGSAAKFNYPYGLALDLPHGVAYIADTNNAIIRKVVLASGQVTTFVGAANMIGYVDDVGSAARLAHPRALVYDGAGTLYFGDDARIRKATVPGGLVSTVAGSATIGSADGPPGTGQVYSPNGLVLDAAKQNLYVTDQLNNTVRKVSLADGTITTVAGQVGHAADVPGPLTTATLNQPQQIVLAPNGDLLVATPREESILRIRLP